MRQGQNPILRVLAYSKSEKTGVSLRRSDGKDYFFRIGTLEGGGQHEIKLDGTPGKFTWEGKLTGEIHR